jgi:ubiquinone/menaquinone biosynthesis C-methylase UbiE
LQYKNLAVYYDIVDGSRNFRRESTVLRRIISEYKVSKGKNLLDVGCGTGRHLSYLVRDFDCTGLDLHGQMLSIARRNAPKAKFVQANMSNFRLRKEFDVILCLFGAIGLVRTYANLERTLRNFTNHLKDGGIIIVENDSYSYSKLKTDYMNLSTFQTRNIKIARAECYQRKGYVLKEEEDYLVAQRGKGIRYFRDLQYVGMFSLKRTMAIMRKLGLMPKFLKGVPHLGNGLLLGVKQQADSIRHPNYPLS